MASGPCAEHLPLGLLGQATLATAGHDSPRQLRLGSSVEEGKVPFVPGGTRSSPRARVWSLSSLSLKGKASALLSSHEPASGWVWGIICRKPLQVGKLNSNNHADGRFELLPELPLQCRLASPSGGRSSTPS